MSPAEIQAYSTLGKDTIGAGRALFGDTAGDAQVGQLQGSASALQAYRAQIAQARMNALRQSMSGYQGANNVLAAMEGHAPGTGGGINPAQMYYNPLRSVTPVQPQQPIAGPNQIAPLPPVPTGAIYWNQQTGRPVYQGRGGLTNNPWG